MEFVKVEGKYAINKIRGRLQETRKEAGMS